MRQGLAAHCADWASASRSGLVKAGRDAMLFGKRFLRKEEVMECRPVLDVAQVAELEGRIAAAGTSLAELMERAGAAVADAALELAREAIAQRLAPYEAAARDACLPLPKADPPLFLVLCGSGNNGGDGWVAARILAQQGFRVVVFTARLPEEIKAQPAHDAAVEAARVLEEAEGCRIVVDPDILIFFVYSHADVVIDAILGTGFSGSDVRKPYNWWIHAVSEIRSDHMRVVAADVPSGLSAQTGAVADPCVKADLTVTMIVQKPGLIAPEAAPYCGEVQVAPLVSIDGLLDGLIGA